MLDKMFLHMILYLLIFTIKDASLINKTHESILNGKIWIEDVVPYQVSLQSKSGIHFCGGSIIDTKHIVTAAHCMYANIEKSPFNPEDIRIWAGESNLTNHAMGIVRNVQHIFVHENYDNISHVSDIAVLRIEGDLANYANVIPVKLPSYLINESVTCNISGWGFYKDSKTLSKIMRFSEINITDNMNCQENYMQVNITPSMICAGDLNLVVDSCKGDSGGPLICNDTLEGIISFGYGCFDISHYGVYTRVYSYLEWIHEQQARSAAASLRFQIVPLPFVFILASSLFVFLIRISS